MLRRDYVKMRYSAKESDGKLQTTTSKPITRRVEDEAEIPDSIGRPRNSSTSSEQSGTNIYDESLDDGGPLCI